MQRTPKILIVSADARLQSEVAAAFKGMSDTAPTLHYCPDFLQGIEAARSRRPDFAFVEMSNDLHALKAFAEELAVGSPETNLAAVFAPDLFGPDTSESAIIIEALRAGMQDFLRRPISRADLEQLLERLYRKQVAAPALRPGKIMTFVSNKGGVGKSTLATSLACGLAQRHPGQVLLVDVSLQLGVCAALLDVKPTTSLTDAARERKRLDETLIRQLALVHPGGLHLLAAPANAVEAAEIDDQTISRILTLARRAYDFVIVDSFPLLDQIMMSVLDLSDRVYLVLESVVPTVLGMVKLVQLLDSLGLPRDRQRIILNRYTGSSDNLKPAAVANRLGRPVDLVVPWSKKIAVAANIGRPAIFSLNRFWGAGKALHELVKDAGSFQALKSWRIAATVDGEVRLNFTDNGFSTSQEKATYERE